MVTVLTHNQTYASPQEALLHYGKKGMRRGVTTKDLPGGTTSSARSEAKQEKRDAKVANLTARVAKAEIRAQEIHKEIAATKPGIKGVLQRNTLKDELANNTRYQNQLNKTAEAVEAGRLTPNQKRLIVGGAILGGAVLLAYGGSKMQSGEFNSLKLRGQAALQRKSFEFKRNESLSGKKSADDVLNDVVQGINPNYGKPGGQMNCRRCTFAYELRRRGYHVDATTSAAGWGQSESGLINALTPGRRSNVSRASSLSSFVARGAGIRAKVSGDTRKNPANLFSADAKDRNSLVSAFSKQPDGARGEAVFNFGGFGHSLAYERFGSKTYIFDTQKGLRYDVGNNSEYRKFIDKWGGDSAVKDVQITRLDNQQLDMAFLSRWATNHKGG